MVSQLNLGTECTFLSRSSAVMRVGLHQSSLFLSNILMEDGTF